MQVEALVIIGFILAVGGYFIYRNRKPKGGGPGTFPKDPPGTTKPK